MDDYFQALRVATAKAGDANMSTGLLIELACAIKHSTELSEVIKEYFVEAFLEIADGKDAGKALNLTRQKEYDKVHEDQIRDTQLLLKVMKLQKETNRSVNYILENELLPSDLSLSRSQARKRLNALLDKSNSLFEVVPVQPDYISEKDVFNGLEYIHKTSRTANVLKKLDNIDYQTLPSFDALMQSE